MKRTNLLLAFLLIVIAAFAQEDKPSWTEGKQELAWEYTITDPEPLREEHPVVMQWIIVSIPDSTELKIPYSKGIRYYLVTIDDQVLGYIKILDESRPETGGS